MPSRDRSREIHRQARELVELHVGIDHYAQILVHDLFFIQPPCNTKTLCVVCDGKILIALTPCGVNEFFQRMAAVTPFRMYMKIPSYIVEFQEFG